jgi:hypothetical protein
MAKQLPMEDLIKKYQYLKSTRQTSPRIETNQKTHDKDNTEFSSKISFFFTSYDCLPYRIIRSIDII